MYICILVVQLNVLDDSCYLFLWHFIFFLGTCSYIVYDKQLMTGPRERVSFVFLRLSMFCEAKPRGTLRSRGNTTHCFPWGKSSSGVCYTSKLWRNCEKPYLLDPSWHSKFAVVSRYITWSRVSQKVKLLFTLGVSEFWPMTHDTFSSNQKRYLSWEVKQLH